MRKLLNTLYVTTPEAYLSKDGTNVVVSDQGKTLFRIPIQNIESICTFGYQGASPGLMRLCAESGVNLSFFSPQGRFIARIQGPVSGNILLRHTQYKLFENVDFATHLASIIVSGKIYNSRITLRRFVRDYPERAGVEDAEIISEKLKRYYRLARRAIPMNELRGIEGYAANAYFDVFPKLIFNNHPHFKFTKRTRRPPTDPINAMLSFGYSLLAADCTSALEGVGLDPSLGVLHAMRPGRHSLALDLMEEFRSYIVDRFVISLINTRQITASDFLIHTDSDLETSLSVMLTDNGRKKFLSAWQNKKKTEIIHPFLSEKVPIGLLPHCQALLLSRYLRGDIDDYPVFLSK